MHQFVDTNNMWLVAGAWMPLAAVSAFVAIRVKMPAALVEIVVGMLAGNLIALRTNAWIDFVAGFGSILLTFLAGAEIDPVVLRKQLAPATIIGAASFSRIDAGLLAQGLGSVNLRNLKVAATPASP